MIGRKSSDANLWIQRVLINIRENLAVEEDINAVTIDAITVVHLWLDILQPETLDPDGILLSLFYDLVQDCLFVLELVESIFNL